MLTTGQIPKSSLNSLSLLAGVSFTSSVMFDEGLRIAQQYGLGDFELELKTLQGGSPKSESNNESQNDNGDVKHEETDLIPPTEGLAKQNGETCDSDLIIEHNGNNHEDNSEHHGEEVETQCDTDRGKHKEKLSV